MNPLTSSSLEHESNRQMGLVSIIIRTYNEERLIGSCLHRIFSQTYGPKEVIIVDSGSTDATLAIARQYSVKIISLPQHEFTYGRALNKGCALARGTYLVFISAHALPLTAQWLSALLVPLQDPGVAAVYGRQVAHKGAALSVQRHMHAHWHEKEVRACCEAFFPYASHANAAIKAELWREVMFDEALAGSEDQLWAHIVQLAGYSVVYEPDAIVQHSHHERWEEQFRRYSRELQGVVSIYGIDFCMRLLKDALHSLYADLTYIRFHHNWVRENIYAISTASASLTSIGKFLASYSMKKLLS